MKLWHLRSRSPIYQRDYYIDARGHITWMRRRSRATTDDRWIEEESLPQPAVFVDFKPTTETPSTLVCELMTAHREDEAEAVIELFVAEVADRSDVFEIRTPPLYFAPDTEAAQKLKLLRAALDPASIETPGIWPDCHVRNLNRPF